MLSIVKTGLIASTLVCLLSGALNAATLTASTGPDASATIFNNFDGINNTSVGTFSGGVPNAGADPLNVLGNNWLSAAAVTNGDFTLTFVNPVRYVGFVWGSIASTDSITVYGAANALLATFTGTDFTTAGGSSSATYANIFAGSGQVLTSIVFSSGTQGCCFETDNFSAIGAVSAIPLPAALPLFASGLGAIGLLGWRRKRKAQAA